MLDREHWPVDDEAGEPDGSRRGGENDGSGSCNDVDAAVASPIRRGEFERPRDRWR
ncbi:hypothetical protein ACFPRL_08130 [Pseudoclavibacter helvolus]